MPRWFVHIDEPYYPSGHVVEARDATGAVAAAWAAAGHSEPEREDRVCFAVAPVDETAFFGSLEELSEMEQGRVQGYGDYEHPSTLEPPPAYDISPLPPGIVRPPDAVADAMYRSKMHAMATFAVISEPHVPEGYNPNPYGEHTPRKPEDDA